MILFLVLAALLVAATVGFIAWPLRHPAIAAREGYTQLVQLRDRLIGQLNELDVEAGDRNVDPGVVNDERARIEAELARALKELEQFPADSGAKIPAPRHLWWTALVVLGIALPLVSGALYFATNRTTLEQLSGARATAAGQLPPMVMEMVGRLERRLAEQPNDAEGWARLGRAYQVLERSDDAQKAYARAHQLAPENVDILSAYAGFLMSANPSEPPPEAVALFRKLHQIDPQHPAALWVLGLNAYNESQYRQAIQFWEALLKQIPPQSEVEPQVQRALEAARAQLAQKR